MTADPPADLPIARPTAGLLSHFWTPLTAVGNHQGARMNAQVCVSVFGASIVPEQPRLFVNLSNTNYMTALVAASDTLAVTLLASRQIDLLTPLGLRSGRDGDKLAGLDVERTAAGDPWFPRGVGVLACAVIEAYDLGDSTAFLCAIREERPLDDVAPLTWAHARAVVGDKFLARWAERSAYERAAAARTMHWRAP